MLEGQLQCHSLKCTAGEQDAAGSENEVCFSQELVEIKVTQKNFFGSHLDDEMWQNTLLNVKKITCSNKSYETTSQTTCNSSYSMYT